MGQPATIAPMLRADRPPAVRDPAADAAAYFPELESLRGIAIAMVYAFHVDGFVRFLSQRAPVVTLPLAFVRAGHAGVDLFFVLSAFLLSLPFLAAARGGRPVDVRRYLARRARRILPAYVVGVLAVTAIAARSVRDLGAGIPHLFLLQSFHVIRHADVGFSLASTVWWSLATEAQFYLVLPLLPLAFRSRSTRMVGAGALVAYAAFYVALVCGTVRLADADADIALRASVLGRGPVFLCGILAAALYLRRGDAIRAWLARSRVATHGGSDVVLGAVLLALAVLLRGVARMALGAESGPYQLWHAAGAACWAAIVLLLLLAPLRTKLVLANRPFALLGVISYSVYLSHVPIAWNVLHQARLVAPGLYGGWGPRTIALSVAFTAACVALSALTYRVVERPFIRHRIAAPASARGRRPPDFG